MTMTIAIEREEVYELIRLLVEARAVPFYRSNKALLLQVRDILADVLERDEVVPYLDPETARKLLNDHNIPRLSRGNPQ